MPILKKLCTLRELQEYYSIDDLCDMIEAIEFENRVLAQQAQEAEARAKRKR